VSLSIIQEQMGSNGGNSIDQNNTHGEVFPTWRGARSAPRLVGPADDKRSHPTSQAALFKTKGSITARLPPKKQP
jgi:hypothetical protein